MAQHQNSSSPSKTTVAVWLSDPNYHETDTIIQIRTKLEQLVHTLMFFNDSEKCLEYLNRTTARQVIFIIDEQYFSKTMYQVIYPQNLKIVYVISEIESRHSQGFMLEQKFPLVHVDLVRLHQRIQLDLNHGNFNFNTINEEKLNRQESTFMYGQLLKYMLTNMDYPQAAFHRMVNYLRDECIDHPKDLKQIEDFASNYIPANAVLYYTKYPFLYRRLNAALRALDVVTMYKMGIFIRDLHQQIVDMHRETSQSVVLTLYRGILVSIPMFENQLKKREGALLSVNEFWSTSTNNDVARIFAGRSNSDQDVAVLFRITVDPLASTTVSLANIRSISQFEDEEEYLFTMESVFRIESIEQIDNNTVWCVSLKLTTDRDEELMSLFQYNRSLCPRPHPFLFCLIICEMGKHRETIQISEIEIESSNGIIEKTQYHFLIGQACGSMLYVNRMVEHFEKALFYFEQLPIHNSHNPMVIMMKSGMLFMEGNSDQALLYLQHEIDHEINNPSSIHSPVLIAQYRSMKSNILCTSGRFTEAQTQNEAVREIICGSLPSLHPLHAANMVLTATSSFITVGIEGACEKLNQFHELNQRTTVCEDFWKTYYEIYRSFYEQICADQSVYDIYPRNESIISESSMDETPAILFNRIHQYVTQMRYSEALLTIDKYLKLREDLNLSSSPDLLTIYVYKGVCHIQYHDSSTALLCFKNAKDFSSRYVSSQHPIRLMIPLLIAFVYIMDMRDEEALRMVEQADIATLKQYDGVLANFLHTTTTAIGVFFQIRAFFCRGEKLEEEALGLFQKSLQIQLVVLLEYHPKVAQTYDFIASSYRMMNKLDEALASYQRAQRIWEKCSTIDQLNTGSNSHFSSFIQNSYKEIHKRVGLDSLSFPDLMNNNPFTYSVLLTNYTNCAEICLLQKNFLDATVYYQCAVDLQLEHFSSTDRDAALLWMKLGTTYDSLELFDEALNALSNALQIYLSMTTPDPTDLATIYKSMGFVCIDTKEYDLALSHFNECLEIQMIFLRRADTALADTHRCIGLTLKLQGNHADEKVYLQQSLQIVEKHAFPSKKSSQIDQREKQQRSTSLYQSSEESSQDHRSMALVCLRERNYEKALEHLEQDLTMQLTSLPSDHLDLVNTYLSIADVMCQTHRLVEAVTYFKYALQILNKHLPNTSTQVLENSLKLGHLHLKLHQFEDSLAAYQEVLTIQFNVLPSNHLDTAATYKQIALVQYIMSDFDHALMNFEHCLKIQRLLLPSHHPDLLDTQIRIDDLRCDLNALADSTVNNQ